MKVVFLVVLFVAVAQILPSCGDTGDTGAEVVGWVDEKYVAPSSPGQRYVIVINHVEHDVLFGFWNSVDVGDLVKWDGLQWTILRKRS